MSEDAVASAQADDEDGGERGPLRRALTEEQRAVLSFERRTFRRPGAKDEAIRATFGLSPTRYYQRLNSLLDHPAALAADPLLVKRLQRLRSERRDARAARRILRSSGD